MRHIQPMHHDRKVYSWHVFVAPSEYIPIFCEKSCKCLAGEGTNPGHSIKVGVIEKYLFKPFNGLYHYPMFFYVHGLELVIHLHHNYVAFACGHLISAQLSYSIISKEFDH